MSRSVTASRLGWSIARSWIPCGYGRIILMPSGRYRVVEAIRSLRVDSLMSIILIISHHINHGHMSLAQLSEPSPYTFAT
jgi:hypothetical protein